MIPDGRGWTFGKTTIEKMERLFDGSFPEISETPENA